MKFLWLIEQHHANGAVKSACSYRSLEDIREMDRSDALYLVRVKDNEYVAYVEVMNHKLPLHFEDCWPVPLSYRMELATWMPPYLN